MQAEVMPEMDDEWPPLLEALREDPALMLLAAVVWRAKRDAPGSSVAREFVRKVREWCAAGEDPGYAVLRAMEAMDRVDG